ncbi:EMILIN-1 [Bagarius yarrelli]|uniref:EMILIN-1 n=1 Tax=Bagarius yarrelli TaxID=175774 RepID=A0A556VU33_BAGYA|nr:EMILIN-1 [Bagarius yarrelli]
MAGVSPLLLLVCVSVCTGSWGGQQRYSLYAGNREHGHTADGARAASRHRNWCAYVVTKTVSCVVEDGVETYVKPDYQPCSWGVQCPRVLMYRTYLRPRYKVAYKIVSEMEWKCCHGYSGEDCNTHTGGGNGGSVTAKPWPKPSNPGHGQNGGSGNSDSDKMKQMEDKIQRLTKDFHDLQSTLHSMKEQLQEEMKKPGSSGGANTPADAAQPEMKATIHNIQAKLDQLDNRTQAHDRTLDSINNHLVNGRGGNDLDGHDGGRFNILKEEILRELERRVSVLHCLPSRCR